MEEEHKKVFHFLQALIFVSFFSYVYFAPLDLMNFSDHYHDLLSLLGFFDLKTMVEQIFVLITNHDLLEG